MTQRSARQHWMLERRESAMAWIANKLFTFKVTGIDGFIKRRLLKKPARDTGKD